MNDLSRKRIKSHSDLKALLIMAVLLVIVCLLKAGIAYWKDRHAGLLPAPETTAVFSNMKVRVTWNKVEGADGYRVYRRCEGGKWECVARTRKRSYTDVYRDLSEEIHEANHAKKKSYIDPSYNCLCYCVRAYRMTEVRGRKKEVLGRYSRDGEFYLERPTVISAAMSGSKRLLIWSTVPNAKDYNIWIGQNGKWTLYDTVPAGDGPQQQLPVPADTTDVSQLEVPAGTETQTIPETSREDSSASDEETGDSPVSYGVQAVAERDGQVITSDYEENFTPTMDDYSDTSILFVGDSITIGSPYAYDTEEDIYSYSHRVGTLTGARITSQCRPSACYHYEKKTDEYKRGSVLTGILLPMGLKKLASYDVIVLTAGTNDYLAGTPLGIPDPTADDPAAPGADVKPGTADIADTLITPGTADITDSLKSGSESQSRASDSDSSDSDKSGKDADSADSDKSDSGDAATPAVPESSTFCGAYHAVLDCLEKANAIRVRQNQDPIKVIQFDLTFSNRCHSRKKKENRDTTKNDLGLTLVDYQKAMNEVWAQRSALSDPNTGMRYYRYKTRSYEIITEENCDTWTADNLHLTKKGYAEYGSSLVQFMLEEGIL